MQQSALEQLMTLLAKLPGVGSRSAQRMALYMLERQEYYMLPLAENIKKTAEIICKCEMCGNMDVVSPCEICVGIKRDDSVICVVENVADLWAMERSNIFRGKYHVLGGVLSAMDGRTPKDLKINHLMQRVKKNKVQEVIIATNATVEGQTTAHYIVEQLRSLEIKISQLAHGMPIGGELNYLDQGTLAAAIGSRHECE